VVAILIVVLLAIPTKKWEKETERRR